MSRHPKRLESFLKVRSCTAEDVADLNGYWSGSIRYLKAVKKIRESRGEQNIVVIPELPPKRLRRKQVLVQRNTATENASNSKPGKI